MTSLPFPLFEETRTPSWWSSLEETIIVSTLVAFLLTSLVPHYALAFSQTAEAPWHPLVFQFPQGQVRQLLFSKGSSTSAQNITIQPGVVISVLASGYSSTTGETDGDPFTTASGTTVREGVVAANFLPIGTRLQWGNKELVVEDRLNARYNDTYMIDVWMPTTEEALQFGVRLITVEVVSLPD